MIPIYAEQLVIAINSGIKETRGRMAPELMASKFIGIENNKRLPQRHPKRIRNTPVIEKE